MPKSEYSPLYRHTLCEIFKMTASHHEHVSYVIFVKHELCVRVAVCVFEEVCYRHQRTHYVFGLRDWV